MELPPLDCDDNERSLGWHALNYRTAHSLHAQDMYEELERFVRAYALEAIAAERERILAALREWDYDITDESHVDSFAAAIRAQGGKA